MVSPVLMDGMQTERDFDLIKLVYFLPQNTEGTVLFGLVNCVERDGDWLRHEAATASSRTWRAFKLLGHRHF